MSAAIEEARAPIVHPTADEVTDRALGSDYTKGCRLETTPLGKIARLAVTVAKLDSYRERYCVSIDFC